MLGKFNPAIMMAAIMGNLAEVAKASGGTYSARSNFSGFQRGRRHPTRKQIEKQRNRKKFKLGRTR